MQLLLGAGTTREDLYAMVFILIDTRHTCKAHLADVIMSKKALPGNHSVPWQN
jgi:hypothetical protein